MGEHTGSSGGLGGGLSLSRRLGGGLGGGLSSAGDGGHRGGGRGDDLGTLKRESWAEIAGVLALVLNDKGIVAVQAVGGSVGEGAASAGGG